MTPVYYPLLYGLYACALYLLACYYWSRGRFPNLFGRECSFHTAPYRDGLDSALALPAFIASVSAVLWFLVATHMPVLREIILGVLFIPLLIPLFLFYSGFKEARAGRTAEIFRIYTQKCGHPRVIPDHIKRGYVAHRQEQAALMAAKWGFFLVLAFISFMVCTGNRGDLAPVWWMEPVGNLRIGALTVIMILLAFIEAGMALLSARLAHRWWKCRELEGALPHFEKARQGLIDDTVERYPLKDFKNPLNRDCFDGYVAGEKLGPLLDHAWGRFLEHVSRGSMELEYSMMPFGLLRGTALPWKEIKNELTGKIASLASELQEKDRAVLEKVKEGLDALDAGTDIELWGKHQKTLIEAAQQWYHYKTLISRDFVQWVNENLKDRGTFW
ncbi:MAG: hypothetical protein RDV48_25490 [Candidatus Eremiobacteraeota bacterium]|nr:hypothetical protein [Candidatus Eremiobacteraeota bacterium]